MSEKESQLANSNGKENNLSVVIALKLDLFGEVFQCEESIRRIAYMVGLGLHQDVEAIAWAIGFPGGVSSRNGTFTMHELLEGEQDETSD